MKRTMISRLRQSQANDPTRYGWRIVEDVIGVDPFLLCEWLKEGAEDAGPLYQFDAGGQTAWAYQSVKHGGFLVADTVDDTPATHTGPLDDATLRTVARLVGDDPRLDWLYDDSPAPFIVRPRTLLEARCCYG